MENKMTNVDMVGLRDGEDTNYFECPDNIDMVDLLTHLQNPTAGKRVLFSKPCVDGETRCYQIKIITRSIQDEESYHDSEVFKCHICNVVVPRMYFREHVQSKIHQSCKKITKKVLGNIFKSFNANSEYTTNNGGKKMSYCAPCSKTVPLQDIVTHNLSEDHEKSLEKETRFHDLVKMFYEVQANGRVNKTVLSTVDTVDTILTVSHDHLKNGIINPFVNKGDRQYTQQPNTSVNKNTSEVNKIVRTNTDEIDNKFKITPNEEILDFKLYVKEMFVKYKLNISNSILLDDPKFLIALAPNGNTSKITIDTFHSFKQINNFVYCQLCKVKMALDAKRSHIMTEKHVRYIVLPWDNGFCRQINSFWSHNLIRNELLFVGMPKAATDTKDKAKDNEDSAKDNEARANDKISTIIFCEICNISIHKNNFQEHTNGKNHKKHKTQIEKQNRNTSQKKQSDIVYDKSQINQPNITMEAGNFIVYLKEMITKYNLKYKLPATKDEGVVVVTPQGRETTVPVDSFHGYKHTESGVYCQLCRITVSGSLKVHSESQIHVQNITQRIDDNFTRKINKIRNHCLVCNVNILNGTEHAATDPYHTIYIEDKVYVPKRKYDVRHVYVMPNSFNEHLNSQNHLTIQNQIFDWNNVANNLEKTHQKNDLQIILNDKTKIIYCILCDRNIDAHNFLGHTKGKKHLAELRKSRKGFSLGSKHDVTDDVTKNELQKNFQAKSQSGPTGKRERSNSEMSLQSSGNVCDSNFLAYLKAMVSKFKLNCVLPVVDNDGVVIVTQKGYKEKFSFDTFHSYKQGANSVVCQVCRMNVLSRDTRAHSLTQLHVTSILQPIDDNFSRKINKTWSHCLVCNLTVLNSFDHAAFSHVHKQFQAVVQRRKHENGNAEKIFCNNVCA